MLPRDLLTHLDDAESNIAGWTRAVVTAAEEARTASAVIENAVRAVGARVLQQRETVDALATKAAWLAQEAQRAAAIAAEARAAAEGSKQAANSAAGEAIRAEQLWRRKLSEAETEQLAAVMDQSRAEAELGRGSPAFQCPRQRERGSPGACRGRGGTPRRRSRTQPGDRSLGELPEIVRDQLAGGTGNSGLFAAGISLPVRATGTASGE